MPDPRFCARCGTGLVAPADPAHKPVCPSCGHFRATNALPVVLVLAATNDGRIVYTRQRDWPAGAWGLVAGYVETGETAELAAVREVAEESGLVASGPHVVRTTPYEDLLLIWVKVTVEDDVVRAGSDVEDVRLARPDLALTPPDWPARRFIEELVQHRV